MNAPQIEEGVRRALVPTALFWAAILAIFIAIRAGDGAVTPTMLAHIAGFCLVGFGLSLALGRVTAYIRRNRSAPIRAIALIAASALAAVLLIAVDVTLSLSLAYGPASGNLSTQITRSFANFGGLTLLFGMLCAAYLYQMAAGETRARERDLAEAHARAASAEARANAARFETLRYQLNPHFLFNTLNAVSSLVIARRNQEAEEMLAKLSDFLRTTLMDGGATTSTIAREFDMLENYLEIEAVRFGGKLRFRFDCPRGLEDIPLPAFLLQPLVENAIKYAVAPAKRPVSIAITVNEIESDVEIAVVDDGDPARRGSVPGGTGLGLDNVRERLRVVYGDRARLDAHPLTEGFSAAVRFPRQALEKAA